MHPLANDQSVIRGGLPAFSVKVTIFESKIDLALFLFLLGPELTDTRAKEDDKNPRTACLAARPAPLRQKKVHLLQGMLPTCLIQGFLM